MLVGGRLNRPYEHVESVCRSLGSLGRDHLVDTGEPDERDRYVPVLALERTHLQELRAQRGRDGDFERDSVAVWQRRLFSRRVGCRP